MKRFLDKLNSDIIVGDGGTGSMIFQAIPGTTCLESTNLDHPETVQGIHLRFIGAGSQVIETNTFGANRFKLEAHGLAERTREINSCAVKLAREAREVAGREVYIAGSIGPTGLRLDPRRRMQRDAMYEAFREQAEALEGRGVDLFMVETFSSLTECLLAVEAVRQISSLPIVASLTFPDEWSPRPSETGRNQDAFSQLVDVGAEVVGINCSMGPTKALELLESLSMPPETPVSVHPNVGVPEKRGGRFIYPQSSPEYFGSFAREAVGRGARLLGGCCGCEPHHIAAIAEMARDLSPAVRRGEVQPIEVKTPSSTRLGGAGKFSPLHAKFQDKQFVNLVQLDPPKGTNTELVLSAVDRFLESGRVDAVDLNSNPMARLHMDSLWISAEIEKRGMETVPHITPRDASLMGLEGSLLGAWRAGVKNVLAVTGDPSQVGDFPGAHDVYQTDSVGLVDVLSRLNEGMDWVGNTVGDPPSFTIGVAVNPNAEDLDKEVDRYKKKIDNGAHFAMTQVFFEWGCWERFLDRLGGSSPIPVLVAVWPLTSYRLALRLHNEVPGIVVPKAVQNRLEEAGKAARAEGFDLAREIYEETQRRKEGGVYIIAPFKNPVAALEILGESPSTPV